MADPKFVQECLDITGAGPNHEYPANYAQNMATAGYEPNNEYPANYYQNATIALPAPIPLIPDEEYPSNFPSAPMAAPAPP